jgi:hypothetical protein
MSHKHLGGFLQNIASLRQARSGRCSSWDQSGKNQDYWVIPPGEEVVLAELTGPGCVTHLWMTQFCRRLIGPGLIDPMPGSYVAPVFEIHNALGVNWEEPDPFYYRKVILKIFWETFFASGTRSRVTFRRYLLRSLASRKNVIALAAAPP